MTLSKTDYLATHPGCTAPEMAKALGIHRNTALRFLRRHVAGGYVKRYSINTGDTYIALPEPFTIYSINETGNVINNITFRSKKQRINNSGYLVVDLEVGPFRKLARVHRLVAQSFIPNPLNLPEVNHLDGNKLNPAKSNLEWSDRLGNMKHASENMLCANKISDTETHAICKFLENKKAGLFKGSLRDIGEQLSIPKTIVEKISAKKTWKHISSQYNF